MKNIKSLGVFILLITVLVMFSSCTTILTRTSLGYDYKEMPVEEYKNTPEWIKEKYTYKNGIHYYVGEGKYTLSAENPDSDNIQRLAEQRARNEVIQEISTNIIVNTNVKIEDTISEKRKNSKIVESTDEISVSSTSTSNVFFSNLKTENRFWKINEKVKFWGIGGKQIECEAWVLCSISDNDLEEAKEIQKDAKKREEKQQETYNKIIDKYKYALNYLQIYDKDFENRLKDYQEQYYIILDCQNELEDLLPYFSTLESNNSLKMEYEITKKEIAEILIDYNPADLQKLKYESRIRQLTEDRDKQISIKVEQIQDLNSTIIELNITNANEIKQKEEIINSLKTQIAVLENYIDTKSSVLEEYTDLIKKAIEALQSNTSLEVIEIYTSKLQKEIANLQKNGIITISD